MFAPKKILVPTDFSAPAEIALEYAKDLARQHNSTLLIIHALEPSIYTGDGAFPEADIAGTRQYLLEASEAGLQKKAAALEKEGFSVITRTLYGGNVASEITDYADANAADLICIATHGRSGWQHLMLGSITEKVLRRAACPVLIVRRKAE